MQQLDYWTQSAEAMEMTIEGNRMIAREIAAYARDLWHHLSNAMIAMRNGERHLPPV